MSCNFLLIKMSKSHQTCVLLRSFTNPNVSTARYTSNLEKSVISLPLGHLSVMSYALCACVSVSCRTNKLTALMVKLLVSIGQMYRFIQQSKKPMKRLLQPRMSPTNKYCVSIALADIVLLSPAELHCFQKL